MKNDERFFKASALVEEGRPQQAFRLFLEAAEAGDVSSQVCVGYSYDVGLGVKKDSDKAIHWYMRAYRAGDSSAPNNIGTIYRDRRQFEKALQWFHRALRRGNADSALQIGTLYISAKKDLRLALKYLETASKSSNATEATVEEATRLMKQIRKEIGSTLKVRSAHDKTKKRSGKTGRKNVSE